jgi:galactoside O-acetyltransferase
MRGVSNSKFLRCGLDVTIWPLAKIVLPGVISIGDSVIIDDFVFIVGGVKTVIGSFVHIASFTSITGGGEFVMEDFSGLSGGVRVYTGNEDYLGGSLTNPAVPAPYRVPSRSFVRIEKHAIIGANAVVLPGVTIGEGAVIGANALVKQNCEPWTVYFGTPARPVKVRPRERVLELESQLRTEHYEERGNYISRTRLAALKERTI